jgi:predicted Rossmann fold flavoprotein
MGASPFGYKVAEQFGLKVWPTRAGLVPLTLHVEDKEWLSVLSGVSVDALVGNDQISFHESMLFTHRGLSGPAVLQISSYWHPGEAIAVDMLPGIDLFAVLKEAKLQQPHKQLKTLLMEYLPKRVIELFLNHDITERKIAEISHHTLEEVALAINAWMVKPNGTEGYRTAEVTLGGVDCDALSSKTMEANLVPGLYFIGEVVDVTGWLGGFNFQWAWSSGWAAGQVV